jgi:hypothetical protein
MRSVMKLGDFKPLAANTHSLKINMFQRRYVLLPRQVLFPVGFEVICFVCAPFFNNCLLCVFRPWTASWPSYHWLTHPLILMPNYVPLSRTKTVVHFYDSVFLSFSASIRKKCLMPVQQSWENDWAFRKSYLLSNQLSSSLWKILESKIYSKYVMPKISVFGSALKPLILLLTFLTL